MFNSKKMAAFFLFFTVLGSAAVFAQTPQLPQQQKVEVSDADLEKFATAFQVIRNINNQAQEEMGAVVQAEGLEIQRFNEIHDAVLNSDSEVTATEDEKMKHQKIIAALDTMQVAFQGKMEKAIADQGLTTERYEQIVMGLQTDPELQERIKKVFES